MGLFAECLRDCDRALQISPSYAKVWYRRGKTNASLKNFDVAHRDLNIAMNLELSVAGKRQVKCELELIAKKHKMARTPRFCGANTADDTYQIKLESVSTPTKGRGMASFTDISPASLIHREEPYAAVVLKKYRESHCHFCFNELSSDTVPCTSCSIPLYCSEHCQVQARGRALRNYEGNCPILETLPCDLKKHIALVARVRDFDSNVHYVPEHSHECGGLHWPAIFPSEIVLAGRILIKSRELSGGSTRSFNPFATSELCHNYSQMSAANKLELHVYSVVLLYCLHQSHGSELPLCGVSVSQLVLLICQVRVNSLAIVRMKSIDAQGPLDQYENCSKATDALTSTVEQVKVAQALYISGSLFNHSCQPNLHVYFRSRTLFIRTTEFVPAGCPLELSYGPQVGQWDCKDRRKFLQDEYSFECHCNGCSEVNMSDIVLNAFRCVDPKCSGVILDSRLTKYDLQAISKVCKLQDGTVKVSDHIFNDVGRCINCGSYRDLESSISMVNDAQICIKRLQDSIASKEVSVDILSDALRGLGLLRSTLHAYNKDIAEAEDNIAQAFCLIGELRTAMHHCEASIQILEKLYPPNHIVIGFELLKLSSIQLSLGDCATAQTINRCDAIFSLYFGPHADAIFPYLQALKADASKMVCS